MQFIVHFYRFERNSEVNGVGNAFLRRKSGTDRSYISHQHDRLLCSFTAHEKYANTNGVLGAFYFQNMKNKI